MEKGKLIYRFHDPNPDKVMETYIRQIMVHNGVDQVMVSLENNCFSCEMRDAGMLRGRENVE